jgi:hypothetical protein
MTIGSNFPPDGTRGFRHAIRSYVPNWLSSRPELFVGFALLYVLAAVLDIFWEWSFQGLQAAFPGLGTPTALPLIGYSRGILRGEAETDASYASRLLPWITTWTGAASSIVLAQQIRAYLANHPTVRIVNRAGFWVTVDSGGTISTATSPWDWDSVSNPERNIPGFPWWSDLWIIVYPTEWPITGTNLASLVGVWGTSQGVGLGHQVPRSAVDAIRTLVGQWRGAHCWIEAIIWSYDATLFVPGSPVAGDPDGTWGNWHKLAGGVAVPARTGAADGRVRFWIPPKG